jgi:DNA-directed RNA polymerase beta' subunit
VPQSEEAQAELRFISAAQENMMSPQGSKPSVSIVQDALLGAYLMTLENDVVERSTFFDISMKLELNSGEVLDKIAHISSVLEEMGKDPNPFTGRGLVSLLFPIDFLYKKKNEKHPTEPVVLIRKGVLIEGTLDKSTLGATHNSLIQVLHKEYGNEIAARFVDGIQFVANNWLLTRCFTVGIKDCLIFDTDGSKEQKIRDTVQKYFMEAEGVKEATSDPDITEMRINGALGKAKDIGLKLAKESLDADNNFLRTVFSGSKGSIFNISQVNGLLGQQNLRGERVQHVMNHGERALVHYPFPSDTVKDEDGSEVPALTAELEYESHGFITSSFSRGLNPREFYFHAMSGREGCSDTAVMTANSGYLQRRIVKLAEDIQTQYDGTVRDTSGRIYQTTYGDDGYDPCATVKVNGVQEAVDVSRLVSCLNLRHEMGILEE